MESDYSEDESNYLEEGLESENGEEELSDFSQESDKKDSCPIDETDPPHSPLYKKTSPGSDDSLTLSLETDPRKRGLIDLSVARQNPGVAEFRSRHPGRYQNLPYQPRASTSTGMCSSHYRPKFKSLQQKYRPEFQTFRPGYHPNYSYSSISAGASVGNVDHDFEKPMKAKESSAETNLERGGLISTATPLQTLLSIPQSILRLMFLPILFLLQVLFGKKSGKNPSKK